MIAMKEARVTGRTPEPPLAERSGNLAAVVLARLRGCPPEQPALIFGRPEDAAARQQVTTFGQLVDRVDELAWGLHRQGLQAGQRIVAMFPPCADLYALILAATARGMTIVFVDPTMGRSRIEQALKVARASAIVSVRAFLRYRLLLPSLRRIGLRFSRDSPGIGVRPFSDLEGRPPATVEPCPRVDGDEALISFTSGSTGPPKGSDRSHELLAAQHRMLSEHMPYSPRAVVLTDFAVVTLHNLACGLPTIMPDSAPAAVFDQIVTRRVTTLCSPPATIASLIEHLSQNGLANPGIERIYTGGAPVTPHFCRRVLEAFPGVAATALYGSTEAEPISSVMLGAVARSEGFGILVGHPVAGAEVTLIDATRFDQRCPAPGACDDLSPYRVAAGEAGEVTVKGPHVTRRYAGDPEADRRFKISCRDGSVWHRTGDLARADSAGRLWLVGRRGDEVRHAGRRIHPLIVEAAVDGLPGVRASALVSCRGARQGELAVALAPAAGAETLERIADRLRRDGLPGLPIRRLEEIPMEPRHRSKIDRSAVRRLLARGRAWRPWNRA